MSEAKECDTIRPADVAELAESLARANADGLGVCIVGGGTKPAWGNRPERVDVRLSTRGLSSQCEVDADDLTATVSAGVTVAEARARARQAGRVLPLDAIRSGLATVGGVTATGDQGLRGAGYGRVRDLVLGLKAVLADGTTVKFGGRTMKNVAGYDMTKLFVGSFGVLGVITEVTIRLLPRADFQGLMILPLGTFAEAQRIVSAVLDSSLQPLVLAAVSPDVLTELGTAESTASPGGRAGVTLLAGFAGHQAAVERSLSDVSAWAGSEAAAVLRDDEAEALLDAVSGFGVGGAGQTAGVAEVLGLRACVPIGRVWRLAGKATELASAAALPLSYRIDGAWGVLDLWVGRPPGGDVDCGVSSAGSFAAGLRAEAEAAGGWLAVTAGSASLPAGHDAWGAAGPSLRLMRGLKERFDPRRTLNPGRFVGGI